MRRPINTVNGFYRDPNLHWSAQDALNVIPKVQERQGTLTVTELVDAPGLKPFAHVTVNGGAQDGGPGRGLRVVDSKLFSVVGRNLYQLTSAGIAIPYGTIPGVGRVSMAHNQRGLGNELAIDNGSSRYVFNTQALTLEKVTDTTFPGSIKAFFCDGYIGYVDPQGRGWGHSDLANAMVYNAFDTYEAEGQPDRIVSANELMREIQIFGQDSTELYVNAPSGSGDAPFQRASNTVIPYGCSAKDSVVNVGGFTVFLDHNRCVRVLTSGPSDPISTSVIESMLQGCTRQQISASYAFCIESEGFQIYYLTVPGKFTFGYDFKFREWHRRASFGLDWWAVTDVALWNGRWIAQDSRNGKHYELDWTDYPFDGRDELVREWTTGSIHADQNPVFLNEIELLFGTGGKAYDPIDFPAQPEGPSISGSAPDGLVDVATTPFQYTISGNAPLKVTLRSGTLPPGLSISQAGVLSGTPTDEGSYTYTLRVTDKYGLWADHTDTVQIRAYLYDFVAVASTGSYFGSTAETWTASSVNGNGRPMTWGKRIILLHPSGNVVSDDYLATTTPKAAPWSGSATLARPTKTPNGRIYVAAGDTNLYYTDDGAETWTTVALGFTVAKLAGDDDVLIVYTDTNHYRVAVGGLTFGSQKSAPANIQDIGYGDGMFMFATASANYYWSEDNGTTLTPVSIPAPGGDTLENYSNFRTKGGAWLAINRVNGNNTNETIARSPDGKQPFVYVTTPSGNMDGGSSNAFAQRGDKIVCPLQFNLTTEFFNAVSGDDGVTWTRHDHGYPGASDFPSSGVVSFSEGGLK